MSRTERAIMKELKTYVFRFSSRDFNLLLCRDLIFKMIDKFLYIDLINDVISLEFLSVMFVSQNAYNVEILYSIRDFRLTFLKILIYPN